MTKRIAYITTIALLIFGMSACRKGPGPGGKASITGKVYVQKYNSTFTVLLSEFYAGDEDVYLVYGDNPVFDDKTSTHHDGTFEFDYLRPGTYTLFVYSKDASGSSASGKIVVERVFEITEKKGEQDIGVIVIVDN